MKFLLFFAAIGFLSMDSIGHACGPDSDCVIGDRHYRVQMPEGHDGKTPIGAIFYMHGYKGSAKAVMRNKGMRKTVSDMGLALVAPKAAYDDWAIPNSPSRKDPIELEYFDAVVADVTKRFPIDPERMMATGFSAGGMMVWNLICDRSELFAAYAPISGTFWAPNPDTCSTPAANVIHTHGTTDRIVPLTGRPIGHTKQGDVWQVFDMYRSYGAFKTSNEYEPGEHDLKCAEEKNANGTLLEMCLHPRGHDMRAAYFVRAWKKFEELGVIAR